jgi:hypothetical protein
LTTLCGFFVHSRLLVFFRYFLLWGCVMGVPVMF